MPESVILEIAKVYVKCSNSLGRADVMIFSISNLRSECGCEAEDANFRISSGCTGAWISFTEPISLDSMCSMDLLDANQMVSLLSHVVLDSQSNSGRSAGKMSEIC